MSSVTVTDELADETDACTPEMLRERADHSQSKLTDLASRVSERTAALDLGSLFMFAAGSYARGEASVYSDIDLFFGYEDQDGRIPDKPRTNEFRLFAHVIEAVDALKFPALSGDCRYLETHRISEVLEALGGDRDDVDNHFTFRMLMLLEGHCLLGTSHYDSAMAKIIEAYYRDYPNHVNEFQPWFLLNDIVRYWKTLTLNYEHNRNAAENESDAQERRVRNFKLKFSRMTTCFASIAAVGAMMSDIKEEGLLELTKLTPSQRLDVALERMPSLRQPMDKLRGEYSWFLNLTGQDADSLHARFEDKESRTAMFTRADKYGTLMYDLLRSIDRSLSSTNTDFLRLLVV
jgi:predicted nucleotidyltransferase